LLLIEITIASNASIPKGTFSSSLAKKEQERENLLIQLMSHSMARTKGSWWLIQSFDFEGTFLSTFGSEGKEIGEFTEPCGITADQVGNIFVSDNENHRVQVFDEKGKFLREFGSEGTGQGELKYPSGTGIFSNRDVIVAEPRWIDGNKRLSVFNSQSQFIRFIGTDKLKDPYWLFIDSHDNILVVDFGNLNTSLLIFSKEGNLLKEIGKGVFDNAWGVVMNGKGDIFVSGRGKDGQHRIFVF